MNRLEISVGHLEQARGERLKNKIACRIAKRYNDSDTASDRRDTRLHCCQILRAAIDGTLDRYTTIFIAGEVKRNPDPVIRDMIIPFLPILNQRLQA